MTTIKFPTLRKTETQYQIVEAWGRAFAGWFENESPKHGWNQIVVLTDEHVWALYERAVSDVLASLNRPIVPVVLRPGEDSKEFRVLPDLVDRLVESRIHRRCLLICVGGGVCCDVGGLLAQLYMRGIDYVNLPTSLMAQIDGAIGGKVGANFSVRKNLLGGFHHPLLVLLSPRFLDTLPQFHFRGALAEALKVAIIKEDEQLIELLERKSDSLLNRERGPLFELLDHCLRGKLDLLAGDPFESNLDRALNLGHAVAHALERLQVMAGPRQPSHGEAVAIGLAATTRYAFKKGLCSKQRALRLLGVLRSLDLPLAPHSADRDQIEDQLSRIPEHRGGLFRLVVPVTEGGVGILPDADIEVLAECLSPIEGLSL